MRFGQQAQPAGFIATACCTVSSIRDGSLRGACGICSGSVFFQPQPAPRRALLLGLGAGTAVTQLQALFPKIAITAVEMDSIHIQLATRHFGIDSSRANIHQGDARDFVSEYQGPPLISSSMICFPEAPVCRPGRYIVL